VRNSIDRSKTELGARSKLTNKPIIISQTFSMSPEPDSRDTALDKGPFIRAEPSTLADPKKYNSWIQFRRNFCRLLARWLMTLLFCGLTFLLYRRTADMGTLKTWGKKVFNALSIALSIVMGLNLVVSNSRKTGKEGSNADFMIERVEIDGGYDEVEYPGWWKMDTGRGLFLSMSNCTEKHRLTEV
jgi:hypothetical protein